MKKLFFLLTLALFFLLVKQVYGTCVDKDYKLTCHTDSPPYEDCVYVGTTNSCRGPDAATSKCECKTVTTPPIQRCDSSKEIETSLGCVNVDTPTAFVTWLLRFAIGIGGGIAFLLMILGAFQIITSTGDPERLKAGKELITSALIGLLMIIFSLFLLQLIGVKILDIPGFAK